MTPERRAEVARRLREIDLGPLGGPLADVFRDAADALEAMATGLCQIRDEVMSTFATNNTQDAAMWNFHRIAGGALDGPPKCDPPSCESPVGYRGDAPIRCGLNMPCPLHGACG